MVPRTNVLSAKYAPTAAATSKFFTIKRITTVVFPQLELEEVVNGSSS